MSKGMISPSVMCMSEWGNCKSTFEIFEKKGIEMLHADVMDGIFVSNLMLGTESIKNIRKASKIPLDIHLMIEKPEDKLEWFDIKPGEYVSVHAESTRHLQATLAKIKAYDAHPMVALNPATPIIILEDVINDGDGILLMTVNPGFAGQRLIEQTLNKIKRLRVWLKSIGKEDVLIEVDGNVSYENAVKMRKMGADIFVCGTSSILGNNGDLEENINKFRKLIDFEYGEI